MIPGFHSSGVWFQDDGQQVRGNCGIYSLKNGRVQGNPLFILDIRGICWWFLLRTRNNMMYNPMRAIMDVEELSPCAILIFLPLKNNRNVVLDV